MDAIDLQFEDETFDVVVCAQNGICAFAVDPVQLILEVLRVVRPGGLALFSSYADSFWPHRLAWFESQAAKGLLGAIDYAHCTNGVIACHDGFRSGRMTPRHLRQNVLSSPSEVTRVRHAMNLTHERKQCQIVLHKSSNSQFDELLV